MLKGTLPFTCIILQVNKKGETFCFIIRNLILVEVTFDLKHGQFMTIFGRHVTETLLIYKCFVFSVTPVDNKINELSVRYNVTEQSCEYYQVLISN